jgi:ribonuclease I
MNHFYLLALQWNAISQTHTIHGLWPQFTNHKWPEYCSIKEFDIHAIIPLVPILEVVWPSIQTNELQIAADSDSNIDFWKHEWMRHGTCNYNIFVEFDYFKKVIELYNEYDYTYKCHSHLPCFVKFDAFFNIMDSNSSTISELKLESVCDCENEFVTAYLQGIITHASITIAIVCLLAQLYLRPY